MEDGIKKKVLFSMSCQGIHRLLTDGYNRPKLTYTDTLQNEEAIKQKLNDYVELSSNEVDELDEGCFLRYIKYDDKTKKEKFVTGGVLLRIYPEFLVLKGKNDGTFSAQRYTKKDGKIIYKTRFFKKLNNEEKLKMRLIQVQEKASEVIQDLEKIIEKKNKEIKELKDYLRKIKKA